MFVKVWILPALQDNYIYVLKNESHIAVVDPFGGRAGHTILKRQEMASGFYFQHPSSL